MRYRIGSAVAAGTLLISSLVSAGNGSPARAESVPMAGVYSGPAVPAGVANHDSFAAWLDTSVPYAIEFLNTYGSWDEVANPFWALDNWSAWTRAQPGRRLVLSVPLLVSSASGQLAQGASGAFDATFRTLAQNMVSRSLGSSVIRLGWEMNNNSFPWWAGRDPAAFRSFYARVVTVMRSVPGAAFTFDWNPNSGVQGGSALTTFDSFYPGDAYVDVIGLDIYDIKWMDSTSSPAARWDWMLTQRLGLNEHRSFAAARAKPVSFPEWGLYKSGDQLGGGGDNPAFISAMAEWIKSSDTSYQAYFDADWGGGSLASFPNGQAEYRQRFGATVVPTTTTTVVPTTTTTVVPTTTTTVVPTTTTTVVPTTTTTVVPTTTTTVVPTTTTTVVPTTTTTVVPTTTTTVVPTTTTTVVPVVLALTNLRHTSVTRNSALITWTTTVPASSTVSYGRLLPTTTVFGADQITSHSVRLSNLQPRTTYRYQVQSVAASGAQVVSAIASFSTARR